MQKNVMMKTILTSMLVVCFSTSLSLENESALIDDKPGRMTFSVVYKETESMVMMSGGVPQKQKRKMGNDFQFDFSFSGHQARFQKQTSEAASNKPKSLMIGRSSFVSSSGEASALPVDEFDTAVYDFNKQLKIGLATVLKKDILVEVPIEALSLGLKVLGESREILGHKARKAVSEDGKTIVWFTNELDIPTPWKIEGIDGVVLEFENDMRTITASSLEFMPINDSSFDLPDRKLLELEQYQDLKKEEMDELMKSVQQRMKESGVNIDFANGGIKIKKGGNQ